MNGDHRIVDRLMQPEVHGAPGDRNRSRGLRRSARAAPAVKCRNPNCRCPLQVEHARKWDMCVRCLHTFEPEWYQQHLARLRRAPRGKERRVGGHW